MNTRYSKLTRKERQHKLMADFDKNTDGPQIMNRIGIPEGVQAGTLADFANIWRTEGYFVIDFIAQQTPVHEEPLGPGGSQQLVVDNMVVSRVKVLPNQILPLIKALTDQSDAWIKEQGVSGI